MSKIELEALLRSKAGTGPARAVRKDQMVPAIIYAKGSQPIACAISKKEITKIARKADFWSTIIELNLEGSQHKVIAVDVQQHPVSDQIIHIDFMFVNEESDIKVHVNLHYIGQEKSLDIKRGGVLNIVKRTIDVICKPHNIISRIDIDVSNLTIGHSLHVKDLALPEGVRAAIALDETIVTLAGRSVNTEETTD